jgi:hypothetical protein
MARDFFLHHNMKRQREDKKGRTQFCYNEPTPVIMGVSLVVRVKPTDLNINERPHFPLPSQRQWNCNMSFRRDKLSNHSSATERNEEQFPIVSNILSARSYSQKEN